jgi:hypothetical protein
MAWLNSGVGAAWTQAVLTLLLIGWSIYDSHQTIEAAEAAENRRKEDERNRGEHTKKNDFIERLMKINFYASQMAQAAFSGRELLKSEKVADGNLEESLQPFSFLLSKAVDGLVEAGSWDLPDETVRQFVNRLLIKGAQLQTIFDRSKNMMMRAHNSQAMGRYFAIANRYQMGMAAFAKEYGEGLAISMNLEEIDKNGMHGA